MELELPLSACKLRLDSVYRAALDVSCRGKSYRVYGGTVRVDSIDVCARTVRVRLADTSPKTYPYA